MLACSYIGSISRFCILCKTSFRRTIVLRAPLANSTSLLMTIRHAKYDILPRVRVRVYDSCCNNGVPRANIKSTRFSTHTSSRSSSQVGSEMLSKSLLASFVTIALAASPHLSSTVIHEQRAAAPAGWVSRGAHAADAVIPLRFGMKQQNLDKLDAMLHAISHPDSPTYGQHMSASEVAETFAPAQESVDVVMAWLDASGVHPDRLRVAASRTWITFK
jgi:hypothetical protein